MSLRLRLLLAVGAVALVALAAADVVTYRSLRTYLYDRVDQSLESSHVGLERAANGGFRGGGGGGGPERAPGTFVQIRDAQDAVLSEAPAVLAGGDEATPKLPAHIGGLRQGPEAGEPIRYLTVDSAEDEGPQFRVRVGALQNGGQLLLALPLNNEAATLHRLQLIELAVTGGALVAAALLGWWLVRLGLRPLDDVEETAVAIADGQLDRRVPGDDARTEVGRVARALNTMLARIEDAFAQRDATEARLRRFVSDASHELRTPLAAVSAYAEL